MATPKPKMKKTPKKAAVDLEKLEDFATAANGEQKEKDKKEAAPPKTSETQATGPLPWEAEGVSAQVPKPFNLRTNQVQIEKLKFVVDNTPGFKSVHAFCLDAVLKAVDKRLKKLLG